VSRIAYRVERVTGTVTVHVAISNPDGILKPGMSGKAAVAIGEKPDVLSIPEEAYDQGTKEKDGVIMHVCLRVVGGRIVPTDVVLGTYDPITGRVEAVEGLKEGDEVVSPLSPELLRRLKEGDSIEDTPSPEK